MHASYYFQSLQVTAFHTPLFSTPWKSRVNYLFRGQGEYEVDSNLIEMHQIYIKMSQQSKLSCTLTQNIPYSWFWAGKTATSSTEC